MSVLRKTLKASLAQSSWNMPLLQSYGVVLSKNEVAKVSGLKLSLIDEIQPDLLPRIKFKGGSSPCLVLQADLNSFLQSDFGSTVLAKEDAQAMLESGMRSIYGEFMSREDVAMVLHVTPVTISRNANELLSPCVEARGRQGGRYLTSNIVSYLLSGRVAGHETVVYGPEAGALELSQ